VQRLNEQEEKVDGEIELGDDAVVPEVVAEIVDLAGEVCVDGGGIHQ